MGRLESDETDKALSREDALEIIQINRPLGTPRNRN